MEQKNKPNLLLIGMMMIMVGVIVCVLTVRTGSPSMPLIYISTSAAVVGLVMVLVITLFNSWRK